MFSLLEQHNDGSWWYHPGCTYNTREEAEERFKKSFWWDLTRPHFVFEHTEPLPQDCSTCTKNGGQTFHCCGLVKWPKELEGTYEK